VETPNKERALDEEVVWDDTKDAISDAFHNFEQSKDQPIGQPKGIILLA
jgi:hypothetical protein